MGKRGSVSIRDVAVLAKVSVGTVSNVLNTPDSVTPATRERVQLAIEKLGFVRNESARSLRAGRSLAVGMLVMDIINPYYTDLVRAAEEVFDRHGFALHVGDSNQNPDREARLLDQFDQQRVRGVLLAPTAGSTMFVENLRRHGTPVVLLDRASGSAGFCAVGADDLAGGRLAAAHLLGEGHRRLAFVSGWSTLPQVHDRRRGAEQAIAEVGDAELRLIPATAHNLASGIRAAREILALPAASRPTGVFAANDLLAIGLLHGLLEAGVRIPRDIALVGYDDIDFAVMAPVPLTTVRQSRSSMGAQAARLLVEEMSEAGNPGGHQHQIVADTAELVVRHSTVA